MKTKNEIKTNWSEATTNFYDACISAHECAKYGYKAWIEIRKNEDHGIPLKMLNPELNNPFNWKKTCGFPQTNEERIKAAQEARFETEKDLILNWDWCFGTPEALKLYEETGEVSKGLFEGMGTCGNVRTVDIVKYIRETLKEEERAQIFEANNWGGLWSPKDGIPYWVSVPDIETYAVYYCDSDKMTWEELKNEIGKSIVAIAEKTTSLQLV